MLFVKMPLELTGWPMSAFINRNSSKDFNSETFSMTQVQENCDSFDLQPWLTTLAIIIIMYSFVCCFSKLEHIAHYKTKNQNTVKTIFRINMKCIFVRYYQDTFHVLIARVGRGMKNYMEKCCLRREWLQVLRGKRELKIRFVDVHSGQLRTGQPKTTIASWPTCVSQSSPASFTRSTPHPPPITPSVKYWKKWYFFSSFLDDRF